MGILRFGAKVGVVGGTLYATSQYGIWRDSKRTEEIYKEVYSLIAPYVKEVPIEIPELPKASQFSSTAREYWNHGVVASAEFLANLPGNSYDLAEKGILYVMEQIKESGNSEQKQ